MGKEPAFGKKQLFHLLDNFLPARYYMKHFTNLFPLNFNRGAIALALPRI